jgi:hypothetical protein
MEFPKAYKLSDTPALDLINNATSILEYRAESDQPLRPEECSILALGLNIAYEKLTGTFPVEVAR